MKLKTLIFAMVFVVPLMAHPGHTDSNGGHDCNNKAKAEGLCSGYHKHVGVFDREDLIKFYRFKTTEFLLTSALGISFYYIKPILFIILLTLVIFYLIKVYSHVVPHGNEIS